jgi:hypothetical protein
MLSPLLGKNQIDNKKMDRGFSRLAQCQRLGLPVAVKTVKPVFFRPVPYEARMSSSTKRICV